MKLTNCAFGLLAILLTAGCDDKKAGTARDCGTTPPAAELPDPATDGYVIEINACELDASHIFFVIETNLPLPVEVVTGVNLIETPPEAIYIGHAERVQLAATQTVHRLDLSRVDPPLPAGAYEAKVAYFKPSGADASPADVWAATQLTLTGPPPKPVPDTDQPPEPEPEPEF
ncbi:MAG: hypothetical protein O7C63_05795 [Alphaproteobacteria bacterium]|nr:hypothetical protein [Alphaproteobacteria bacterium]